jgi:hypothetical protein
VGRCFFDSSALAKLYQPEAAIRPCDDANRQATRRQGAGDNGRRHSVEHPKNENVNRCL